MPRSLAEQPLNTPATITAIDGSRTVRRRLLELGLLPGTTVTISNVAPLGDPLELTVRSSRLSIRRREACAIFID